MKILVIAAHPDDEIYGMGGTISKLSRIGHEVYTLIVTDGCTAQYKGNLEIVDIKKEEAIKANKLLGVKDIIFGNFPDMKLDTVTHIEINKLIEDAIYEVKPEVVYTHHYGDVNKDHRLVYESTMVAVRPTVNQCVKKVLSYQVPSSSEWSEQISKTQFGSNVYIDISCETEKKNKAIQIYNTEIREFPHPRSLEYVDIWDKSIGLRVGLLRAESFHLIRSLE